MTNYAELTLDTADAEQAEILTAELADFPFESFEQERAAQSLHPPAAAGRLQERGRCPAGALRHSPRYLPEHRAAKLERAVGAEFHTGRGRRTAYDPRAVPHPRVHGDGGGHHAQNVVRHGSSRHDLPDGRRSARPQRCRAARTRHGQRHGSIGDRGRSARRSGDRCGRHRRMGLRKLHRKHSRQRRRRAYYAPAGRHRRDRRKAVRLPAGQHQPEYSMPPRFVRAAGF